MSQSRREQGIRLHIIQRSRLGQDVIAFLVDRQARGLSAGTVVFHAKKLRHLQTYLERRGVLHAQSVTPTLWREYVLDLGKRLNPGGVRCAFRAMRGFFRWYESEHEPVNWSNPIYKVKAPRLPQQALDPVSLSDLRAMLATCERHTFAGDRDRAILLCLLDTGCRASEFVALDVGDVNMSTGAVIIRKGKGGKFRTAFMGASTRREVLRYLRHRADAGGPLWVTMAGARLTYAGLRQVVRPRAVAAGVLVPSLHSFRQAFALACLRGGMDVYSLQKLMGHADLSVLRRHLAQTEADLQAAHQRAGPVDNLP